MIAFLGMGLLGSNFVRALINKGNSVQVWNRTTSKATALEAYGAKAFADVTAAVKGASRVHITLKDDHTVDEVLAAAAPGLQPGAVIIDHTTTSADGAVQRTKDWKARGFTYLHAPVFMGPQNALESTGYMLVSGDQEVIATYTPVLAEMTGQVINFGDTAGKAAGMKLIGNSFLVSLTAGLADTLSLAKALNIPISDVTGLFGEWNPGNGLAARIKRMASGSYDSPSWELNMARKDTQLFIDAAAKADVPLAILPAIAKEMDQWIAKGHGQDDWTVIGKNSI
ncbi:3-hydroxyisobutyrate dehydrogenase [Chitinophaga polysaccharea]|uniref:3-hydroxyisobutyrate dehydrogenase n=1 Tax=Chitinophaga polysaccharea TaxID=1293035 RepID=A0A561PT92_9BACT|nr:NAD(P)-dependent oxidoreductase [Chitinophaga polysaccharea]TWF41349.1 3-hydroxyisobutyrate dehydrogenase [Chitinophaga polysaccharea]